MTVAAFAWRVLINNDNPPIDLLLLSVTETARYVLMGARERKVRFLFVVELGSRPSAGGMTARTIDGSQVLELASMNVLVAGVAFLGRFEWNVARFLARVAHLVTSQACDRTVPARQSKLGQAVIERLQLLPGN